MTSENAFDKRLFSPSANENKDAVLNVLRHELPYQQGALKVLEAGSGTGQHAFHFCKAMPHLNWYPSDVSPESLDSIKAYQSDAQLPNLMPPQILDLEKWTTSQLIRENFDILYSSNVIHISPWAAALGLLELAGSILRPTGRLITYGPYFEKSGFAVQSNIDFNEKLKSLNPLFGLRYVEDLQESALSHGLSLTRKVSMPSNNLILIFTKI